MKRYILFISIISMLGFAGGVVHGDCGPSTSSYSVGSSIVISSEKTTLADTDYFAGLDSENGNALAKWTWANIKTALTTYFDTLYYSVSGYAQVDTESELATAIAAATPVIVARADITLTSNHTIAAGQTYSALPGAIVTTHYSVAGGGSNWTVHSGSVYVSTANYNEIEFLRESGTALTEVAGAADIDAAGKWAWEANKIYVRTTGSVDPDTLGAGLLVAGHTLTFATGSHLEDNGGQMFDASPGEVVFGAGVVQFPRPEWWGAHSDGTNATVTTAAINAATATYMIPKLVDGGTYLIDGPIIVRKEYGIEGESRNGSTIKAAAAITMIESNTVTNGQFTKGITIRNLKIDGGGVATLGIELGSPTSLATEINIDNIHMTECLAGIKINMGYYNRIANLKMLNTTSTTGIGLHLPKANANMTLDNVVVQGYKYNWWFETSGVVAINSTVYTQPADSWTTNLVVLHNAKLNTFIGCSFEHQANYAIDEILVYDDGDGVNNTSVSNNFDTCRFLGVQGGAYSSLCRIRLGQTGGTNRAVYKTRFVNCDTVGVYFPMIILTNAMYTTLDRCYQHNGYGGLAVAPPGIVGNLDTTFTRVISPDLPYRKSSLVIGDYDHIYQIGEIIWNSAVVAGGSPGWTCTAPGMYANTSFTGDTTLGSDVITVTSGNTGGMIIGAYVTVSAGFASTGPFKIIGRGVAVNSVKIDAAATSSQVGVTVAHNTAVFKALPTVAP